ncbi:hypothetical protein D6833_12925 [Candidatus Parcubacteria bacterium]|nr:MAG: hypothetical protein D6833_12925 [Candidatus Parcubacteria bacterium]
MMGVGQDGPGGHCKIREWRLINQIVLRSGHARPVSWRIIGVRGEGKRMGKHERGDVWAFERAVCEAFNRGEMDIERTGTVWDCFGAGILEAAYDTFPNCVAEHVGNDYSCPGDIRFLWRDGSVSFLEIKLSESSKGVGTALNAGQNLLTAVLARPCCPKLISWEEWRVQKGFGQRILACLCALAPGMPPQPGRSLSAKIVRTWRELVKRGVLRKGTGTKWSGDPPVDQVLQTIESIARESKCSYLEYLEEQAEFPSERLAAFLLAVLEGVAKQQEMRAFVDEIAPRLAAGEWECFVGSDFHVFYGNIRNGKPIVQSGKKGYTSEIVASPRQFWLDCGGGQRASAVLNGSAGPLFRFQLHWKNKIQGIETPCVNGFWEAGMSPLPDGL